MRTDAGMAQREALMVFLQEFEKINTYPPSIAELARALDVQRTTIIWHLRVLRDEGLLNYTDGAISRSLKVR